MSITLLSVVIALIATLYAAYSDIKTGIIPNRLTIPLIVVGIILNGVKSLQVKDPQIIIYALILTVTIFILGYILWRAGAWAGGDVKLFTGLAALLPFQPYILRYSILGVPFPIIAPYPFPFTLIVNSILAMLPFIKGGIPVKVVQEGQSFNGKTPEIRAYVSIEGLEDPYIWINTKHRQSNVIYKYPYYATNGTYFDYRLNESVDDNGHLQHLWYCLNGTDNPSSITPRPYYIVDSSGLSFFDRLENRSSGTNPKAGMSTFIIGNPLIEDHNGNQYISKIDREYFAGINGGTIKVKGHEMVDPFGSIFCLSQYYKELLGLAQNNYS